MVENLTEAQVKAHILDKLHRHSYWGGRHTAVENLRKGLPSHLGIERHIKDLIRSGWLMPKTTFYGLQISLNPKHATEIFEFIQKYHKK